MRILNTSLKRFFFNNWCNFIELMSHFDWRCKYINAWKLNGTKCTDVTQKTDGIAHKTFPIWAFSSGTWFFIARKLSLRLKFCSQTAWQLFFLYGKDGILLLSHTQQFSPVSREEAALCIRNAFQRKCTCSSCGAVIHLAHQPTDGRSDVKNSERTERRLLTGAELIPEQLRRPGNITLCGLSRTAAAVRDSRENIALLLSKLPRREKRGVERKTPEEENPRAIRSHFHAT